MKLNIYSLHDTKTGFQVPTFAPNDGAAVRDFGNAVMSERGLFANYAADFVLYRIGSVDLDTGELTPCDPESLVNGMRFVAQKRGDADA